MANTLEPVRFGGVCLSGLRRGVIGVFALALLGTPAGAKSTQDKSCFARALPTDIRDYGLDDAKLLTGWVFDAAAAHHVSKAGDIVDRRSGLKDVPGFAGATDLGGLRGRYRVMRAPFDLGHGYYGIEFGALTSGNRISNILLVNRLFRLPIVLHQPVGVATDVATNGAMLFGWQSKSVKDANSAAATASGDAVALGVPLLTVGQSQAGGVAQLQIAYLTAKVPHRPLLTGFVTLNAAPVDSSVRRLGLSPDTIDGINFVKDLDPGFGPHGLLPNRIGLQVYIHPDGTGSDQPGHQSAFAAWGHAGEHLLSTFNRVSLGRALASALHETKELCPADR
ncbi:MAG TPA: hypothetical protein VJP60_01510 [Rhizomicrobium sp.]|nr:hypothetical protein [Rhizomicrobium sp.]